MVHLDLIRDGTAMASPEPPFATVTDAPSFVAGEWNQLGLITVASELPNIGTPINIVAPKANGGTLELRKRIYLGPIDKTFNFTAVDYSTFTVELAAMAGAIDDSATAENAMTIYTPFSGDTAPILGWWRVRWIDSDDVQVRSEVLWGELRLGGALAAGTGGAITPTFTLLVFKNASNQGQVIKRSDA